MLAKKVSKAKCDVQNKVRAEILERYGGHEHLESIPKELILGQWESYAEYSPTGRMIRGAEKPTVKSRYEEDVFNNNHTVSVYLFVLRTSTKISDLSLPLGGVFFCVYTKVSAIQFSGYLPHLYNEVIIDGSCENNPILFLRIS